MVRVGRRIVLFLAAALVLSGCSNHAAENGSSAAQTETETSQAETERTGGTAVTSLPQIDATKWKYNSDGKVYWQTGISYCADPADEEYETLGIFVPAAYMNAKDNGDGTFTCTINSQAAVKGYTADSAPIVIPVNTPGYSAMTAPTDYVADSASYTAAGFIYVAAGCRGRDAGAPAGVTDLKAAIRYIRYNDGVIPGDVDRVFSFGMSGGGAQSALLGATGDSEDYEPYLTAIGAVSGVSDAVTGSMCWCPITELDYADEAYEWNLGSTRTDLTEQEQTLSNGMAEAFAQYINDLGLKDSSGNVLTLTESEEGIYQSGTYYEYLKGVVETSLNNFLEDTTFPYTVETKKGPRGGGGRPDGKQAQGTSDENKAGDDTAKIRAEKNRKASEEKTPEDKNADGDAASDKGNGAPDFYAIDGVDRNLSTGGVTLSGTYETVQDYIDALNADGTWVNYDGATNTATITSIADFTNACKRASKGIGAFDALDESQAENTLFGYGDGTTSHFDATLAELLKDDETYGAAFTEAMEKTDSQGNTVTERGNMYNPLYYLSNYYDGYQKSTVADYWRIRTGIAQSDTSLTTEVNLVLALRNYGADVDFAPIWGEGHTMAESTGDSVTNFIEWVNKCLK
ncbi:tannase [Clostridium sp. AM16-23]|nr:subtype A tannase [Clostridium sp. AM16-23]RHO35267.1 tannase [Clostridium sp. AM16-23]